MTKVYNLGTGIIFSLQSNPFKKKQTMILVAVPSWTLPRPEDHQDIYHNLQTIQLTNCALQTFPANILIINA